MAFTEFYCDTATGANINAGDATANGVVTSTNGAWSTVTNIFTATAGTPFSGVSVGDFASLYLDGGTLSVYVARVTAVGGGGLTLTLSSTAKSGTAPTTAGIGVSCTTGGKWKGPNAAVAFPFGFVQNTMTNAAGDFPRINIKNGTNYAITAVMTHPNVGPIRWQGYTSAAGDGGKATIDGGTSGASYNLLAASCTNNDFVDLIFQNNGASAALAGVSVSGAENNFLRCVVNNVRGNGFASTVTGTLVECEAYACNQANTAAFGGFNSSANGANLLRCISHDNVGSNSAGFVVGGSAWFNCIADTNGGIGFNCTATVGAVLVGCDSYNNTSDGVRFANASAAFFYLENCNLVKNGGYGVNGSGAGTRNGSIVNCGFGAGTQVNTSGTTTGLSALVESGSITYASDVTPWIDPANGDFRVNLPTAKGAGRGAFTQTAASYAGTVGYPDVGAGQHQDSGGLFIPVE